MRKECLFFIFSLLFVSSCFSGKRGRNIAETKVNYKVLREDLTIKLANFPYEEIITLSEKEAIELVSKLENHQLIVLEAALRKAEESPYHMEEFVFTENNFTIFKNENQAQAYAYYLDRFGSDYEWEEFEEIDFESSAEENRFNSRYTKDVFADDFWKEAENKYQVEAFKLMIENRNHGSFYFNYHLGTILEDVKTQEHLDYIKLCMFGNDDYGIAVGDYNLSDVFKDRVFRGTNPEQFSLKSILYKREQQIRTEAQTYLHAVMPNKNKVRSFAKKIVNKHQLDAMYQFHAETLLDNDIMDYIRNIDSVGEVRLLNRIIMGFIGDEEEEYIKYPGAKLDKTKALAALKMTALSKDKVDQELWSTVLDSSEVLHQKFKTLNGELLEVLLEGQGILESFHKQPASKIIVSFAPNKDKIMTYLNKLKDLDQDKTSRLLDIVKADYNIDSNALKVVLDNPYYLSDEGFEEFIYIKSLMKKNARKFIPKNIENNEKQITKNILNSSDVQKEFIERTDKNISDNHRSLLRGHIDGMVFKYKMNGLSCAEMVLNFFKL